MTYDLPDLEFQRFWRRLQRIGLNAYEARSYLVLIGHPRFKALELAARANVPRQKIYEVLDSLVEKGFAQVIQEKTKLFSAIEPELAIQAYFERKANHLKQELMDQNRLGTVLVKELRDVHHESQDTISGALDYLRIINDPGLSVTYYRSMLTQADQEYLEFSRPPYATDLMDEELVRQAIARGVNCRVLVETNSFNLNYQVRLDGYRSLGVEVRCAESLPLKLALFDGKQGLTALLDPVVTRTTWTSIIFEHAGFASAMKGLFENHWEQATPL